jgi:hypothetical protein
LRALIARLRLHGVTDIIVRLDKDFFARKMVECLMALEVAFVLKVSDHAWVRRALGVMARRSRRTCAPTPA